MAQTNREALSAILHYKNYGHVPVLHFGFWPQTLLKWVSEGHLKQSEVDGLMIKGNMGDGNQYELEIARKLGFDDNAFVYVGQRGDWYDVPLFPMFEERIIEYFDDGSYSKIDYEGVMVKGKEGAASIPGEFGHTLVDRASWETEYLPRLQWTPDRIDFEEIDKLVSENDTRTRHLCVYAGSLYGKLRNYWGLVELSYLQVDDIDLFKECIETVGELSLNIVENTLKTGIKVDFLHFWEDVCFNKGPLVQPEVFRKFVGPYYRKIVDIASAYGIDIVSVDCDGFIEDLVPIWLDNGVNTMLPIEVGAWEYDFSTMRKKFGKEIRGIGNMKKHVLAESRESVDAEIERLRKLVDLGGFVPCPDHRIAPDAKWDLVKYYCEEMHKVFS